MDIISNKKRILVIYDYFSPSYKAGGPTQSIINLVTQLHDAYDFEIICSSYELNPRTPLTGIEVNKWNNWKDICRVFYWDNKFSDLPRLKLLLQESKSDIVFVNGVYSFFYNILPILFFNRQPVVLSARGMLKPEALQQKAFKKKVFLRVFKMMKWEKKVSFHATDDEEAAGIYELFGKGIKVHVAGNFPNILDIKSPPQKQPGKLSIITISLMNRIKNHLEVLKALKKVHGEVVYTIYGPVHDTKYVEEVLEVIRTMPKNIIVNYKGELRPDLVPECLSKSQVFVLPSKSENFGHSIFEALSAGRPVITSVNTPWKRLQDYKAGETVDLEKSPESLLTALQSYIDMDTIEYEDHCRAARVYAEASVNIDNLKQQYFNLFNF